MTTEQHVWQDGESQGKREINVRWAALGADTLQHEDDEEAHVLSYRPRPSLAKPGTYLRDIKYLIGKLRFNSAIEDTLI
jgi:hypothetical protein